MSGFLPTARDKFSVGLWAVEVDGLVAIGRAFERLDRHAIEHLVGVR